MKLYIKPETKTIKVELQQMIAESLPTGDGDKKVTGSDQFLGREFGFFDESEEEE
ncbi:MAG: hypothetical protein IJJ68_04755 [Prevotella sp.]|nr:hypothetical protein [Prevotella sp.]